jgi:hypothetical protein
VCPKLRDSPAGFLESGGAIGASLDPEAQWAHMPDGCSAETTGALTSGLRAFAGKTSMDFSLSALRFIVAVCSFFGFNVRVLDSLMNAPSNSPALEIEAELHGCGV